MENLKKKALRKYTITLYWGEIQLLRKETTTSRKIKRKAEIMIKTQT